MKKTSFLVVILVLAMGALGVGFSAWTQGMQIHGTVITGYIASEFTYATVSTDKYVTIQDIGYTPTSPAINNPETGVALNNQLNITFKYAYPGYRSTVTFDVKNTGKVPFFLQNLEQTAIKVYDGGQEVTDIAEIANPVQWSGIIVDVGDTKEYSFDVFVPGEMVNGFIDPIQWHTYTFVVTLTTEQSNTVPITVPAP